ncbi:MAG: tetratricopeptide repeat protein [Rhodoferax sp.]|uniref:tetratricopeptide repeat protein n=1 Tax=Rhodoferax sp. TaxID=50421 RepID=UPI003015E439
MQRIKLSMLVPIKSPTSVRHGWIVRQLIFCAGLYFVFFSGSATAQTVESLEWVDISGHAVARITFNASVRFLRQSPLTSTDLSQVSFQIVAADEPVLNQSIEEGKRLAATIGKVGIVLTYAASPNLRTKLLTLKFTEKVHASVRQGPGARAIDIDFDGESNDKETLTGSNHMPAMVETPSDRHFALVLQTFSVDKQADMPRVPVEFQDYAVFTRVFEQDGVKYFALAIGYFQTEKDAEKVRQKALDRFPSASILQLEAPPGLSTVVNVSDSPLVPAAGDTNTGSIPAEPESTSQVNSSAENLLIKGRQALAEQRWQDAVDAFNHALLLPPNPSSQETQELIGSAWMGLNQPNKARIEYQLYLKLYPQGDGAKRVAQLFAALGGGLTADVKTGLKTEVKPVQPSFSYTGSISQYYYGGQTKTDSLVNISAGIDQNTLSRTNQSALVTSVDVSTRYKTENADVKLVLRDTYSHNFITSTNTQSGLSSMYVDYRLINPQVDVRLGRQSAIGGSMFGLFDGVSLTMPIASKLKLNAMAGVPVNTLVSAPSQRLTGVMLEADSVFEHWGGNISLVDQTTEGISDRRAVGLELRYFGESLSMYSQVDYDINFRALNALTMQGSLQGPYDTTLTMLLDNRKAPSLQLSNALISSGFTSLKTLLQLKSLNEVQGMAVGTAAQARQAMFSVSRALSPKWQGSVDFRASDVGALPAVGTFEAVPATGAQMNVSFQLTGSNLYSKRDINGFNLSVLTSDTLRGVQFAYNNLTGFLDNKASIEPSIRVYTQTDNTETKVLRVSPGLRISYKVTEKASVLGETIFEHSKTDGPTNHEDSSSVFFYVGYRYDFY